MTATYWIKLYHEILNDPKMATLPDRLWRRAIELFLLAGQVNKDGNLPDAREIAWTLRISTDDCLLDLRQLESTGIIQQTATGWLVVKFSARQSPANPADRMAAMRDKRKREQYYGEDVTEGVTDVLRNVTQITDTDTEQIQKQKQIQNTTTGGGGGSQNDFAFTRGDLIIIGNAYQKRIGRINDIVQNELSILLTKYAKNDILEAIEIAAVNGVRKLSYIDGILKRKAEESAAALRRSDYEEKVER